MTNSFLPLGYVPQTEEQIAEWYYYEQEDGYKYYQVWHYNYCNDGEIVDLSSDPVFGWEEERH